MDIKMGNHIVAVAHLGQAKKLLDLGKQLLDMADDAARQQLNKESHQRLNDAVHQFEEMLASMKAASGKIPSA